MWLQVCRTLSECTKAQHWREYISDCATYSRNPTFLKKISSRRRTTSYRQRTFVKDMKYGDSEPSHFPYPATIRKIREQDINENLGIKVGL